MFCLVTDADIEDEGDKGSNACALSLSAKWIQSPLAALYCEKNVVSKQNCSDTNTMIWVAFARKGAEPMRIL